MFRRVSPDNSAGDLPLEMKVELTSLQSDREDKQARGATEVENAMDPATVQQQQQALSILSHASVTEEADVSDAVLESAGREEGKDEGTGILESASLVLRPGADDGDSKAARIQMSLVIAKRKDEALKRVSGWSESKVWTWVKSQPWGLQCNKNAWSFINGSVLLNLAFDANMRTELKSLTGAAHLRAYADIKDLIVDWTGKSAISPAAPGTQL